MRSEARTTRGTAPGTQRAGEDGVRCMRDWEEIKRPTAGRWFRFIGGKEGVEGNTFVPSQEGVNAKHRGNLWFLLYSRSASFANHSALQYFRNILMRQRALLGNKNLDAMRQILSSPQKTTPSPSPIHPSCEFWHQNPHPPA